MNELFDTLLERIQLEQTSRLKAGVMRALKVLLLALRDFTDDQCSLRASALTLYTLLAVVPVMALAFGIAKGFGYEKLLERELLNNIPGQEQSLLYIIDFARKLLEDTQGGLIAGIGVVVLLWSVVKVLGNIESALNYIWEIQENRSFERKFSDYLSIALLGPFLLVISSSISVFITTQITTITEEIWLLEIFSPVILSSLKLIPYGLIWILFSFTYIVMPNTHVKFLPGILGGLVAGTIYQLVQWGYIYFQLKVSNYNAIYGSFAALPFFILWLQISWMVVLFGAEICFYSQHLSSYHWKHAYSRFSLYAKKLLSLRLLHVVVQNFAQGKPACSASQIADTLKLPLSLIQQLLPKLIESDLIAPIIVKNTEGFAYQPAKALDTLSITYVIAALEKQGYWDISSAQEADLGHFITVLNEFDDALEQHPGNILLRDISSDSASSSPTGLSV